MDDLLDRVRDANPATAEEFAGRADFDALRLPARRSLRRWLALPAVGAVIAALIVIPSGAPAASEVLRRATEAMAVPADSILYAKSHAFRTGEDYGVREVWVYGDRRMRWLDAGNEEVYTAGQGTTRIRDGKRRTFADVRMVPNEIFRAKALVDAARASEDVTMTETADAYVLRWREPSGPPHHPAIEMTLWVDKDTYAPKRFTDHSWGKDVNGKDFDDTYTEDVLEFETLPATPENLKLLDASQ